jgi:CRISPR-associated protein Cas1
MMSRPLKDLHLLPKVRDSWSYLYVEHAKIDQDQKAIAIHDANGKVPVPCASLTTLMLGPGTSITHAAIRSLADNGCLVIWSGEEGVRYYAQGMGETRSAQNLYRQATLWADPATRLEVVYRMYRMRFADPPATNLTLQQLRGLEGVRVREAYAAASRETGVEWKGRSYKRDSWEFADPINRALSCANSCLYGVVHAAIVSAGYSPALGFIHTGRMLSFVYDIADLYKADLTIPVSFRTVAEGPEQLERRVRYRCREIFQSSRLLGRIIPAIDTALGAGGELDSVGPVDFNLGTDAPGWLWDPTGIVEEGVNWADVVAPEGDTDGGDGA